MTPGLIETETHFTMNSILAIALIAVASTASAQLDFQQTPQQQMTAPSLDLIMTGAGAGYPGMRRERENKMMNFDPSMNMNMNNPVKYQGPFSRQFYQNTDNLYNPLYQQEQQQQQQQPIPFMGNTIDQMPLNPGQVPMQGQGQGQGQFPGQFQDNGRLLSLSELMNTPLFTEYYYKYPLFRQFVPMRAFQAYLESPLFQNYWRSPIFEQFFADSAHFFRHVYPLLVNFQQPPPQQPQSTQMQPPQPLQPINQMQVPQQQQYPYQFQNQPAYNPINYEGLPQQQQQQQQQPPTPFNYNQGQFQGQFPGQDFEMEMRAQKRYQNRLRRMQSAMLWNLIVASHRQPQNQHPEPQTQFIPPAPLPMHAQGQPEMMNFDRGSNDYQPNVPLPMPIQLIPQQQPEQNQFVEPQSMNPNQNQERPIVMMIIEEDPQPSQQMLAPEVQKSPKNPQLERFLMERMLRALFLNKLNQQNRQIQNEQMQMQAQSQSQNQNQRQEEEAGQSQPIMTAVPLTIVETTEEPNQKQGQEKEEVSSLIQNMPIVDLQNPVSTPIFEENQKEEEKTNENLKDLMTEIKKAEETPTILVRGEPIALDTQSSTSTESQFTLGDDTTVETKKELTPKKLKLIKMLGANKRFAKYSTLPTNKDVSSSPVPESTPVSIQMQYKDPDMTEVVIDRQGEVMTGAEEKIINKQGNQNENENLPSPALLRYSSDSYSDTRPRRHETFLSVPANSPHFLEIMQMLRNRPQQQQQPQPTPGQYVFQNLEGQEQVLGGRQPQASPFHYSIAPEKNGEIMSPQAVNPNVYQTINGGLSTVPLMRGQSVYAINRYANVGDRYGMPPATNVNNNYEAYSLA